MKKYLLMVSLLCCIFSFKSIAQLPSVPWQVEAQFTESVTYYGARIQDFSLPYSETQRGYSNYSDIVEYDGINLDPGSDKVIGYGWCWAQPSLLYPLQLTTASTGYVTVDNTALGTNVATKNITIKITVFNNQTNSQITSSTVTVSKNQIKQVALPTVNQTYSYSFPTPPSDPYQAVGGALFYNFNITAAN